MRLTACLTAFLLVCLPCALVAQERERIPVEKLRAFAEVYGALRHNYIESLDHDVMIRNAIEGLLKLDPLAAYLEGDEYKELFAGSGAARAGIGVEVTQKAGTMRVVSPIEGTPAAHAGLKADDAILKIDDVDVQEKKLSDAVKLLRGKPGSTVKLSVQRPGEPVRDMTITREIIRIQSVRSRMVNPSVAYVRVVQFQEATAEIMARQIAALFAGAQPKLLVLDLRSNPGGLLQSAVAAAALFLPENAPILHMEGRAADSNRDFRATAADYLRKGQQDPKLLMPQEAASVAVAVLVDRGTAAGSEFVAAALRDNKRAVVIGERTFGRGLVQTIIPLTTNSAVKLTTGRYQSPGGAAFEGVGLQPDVVLAQPVAVSEFGKETDRVLDAAIEKVLGKRL